MNEFYPHIRIPVRRPASTIPRRVPRLPVRFSARQMPSYSNGTTTTLKRAVNQPKLQEPQMEVEILSKEEMDKRRREKRRKKVRLIKTFVMILAWVCMVRLIYQLVIRN